MIRRSFVFAAFASLAALGCASTPEDPNAPEACIILDNTDGGGLQSQVYLIGATDNSRNRIGTVAMGRTTRWCSRNLTLPARYYILIERPAVDTMDPALGDNNPPPVRSDDFQMSANDVWTWHIRVDRVLGALAPGEARIIGLMTCAEAGPGGGGDC